MKIIQVKNDIKFEKNKINNIKCFALFLSEFSFLLIFIIIGVIGLIFPFYHETKTYISKEGPSWNSSSDPLIFTHLSDIHIANYKGINKYRNLFRTVKKLGANFHLITGDIADDYKKELHPKVGKQNNKDWKYYKELIDTELYNETIIEIAGNHDMFGVISPFKTDYGFLDASRTFKRNNTKTLRDFWIKTVNIEGFNFILLNPYSFPVIHPPYIYYPHPSKKFLNLLEQEINKVGPCFILCHFPIDFFWWKKNKKGNNLRKIMKNRNVQYIFTGHSHPGKFEIKHHEYGGLEFVGSAYLRTDDFGLVTIDNGRLVYNRVEFKENNFINYYMTNPVPMEQLSNAQNFNEKNTEIRIISYKNEIEDNLYITGDFSGQLKYQRELKNGAKLYSIPLNVKYNGKYNIKFISPDYQIEREFYVGKYVKIKGERISLIKTFALPVIIGLIILLVFLLIITFPMIIINFSFIDDWILGNIEGKWYYWIICIFLSPFILNNRINDNAPIYFRIILFFCLIYPLALPFHFFEPIKGKTGYSFLCFYLIKNKVLYDEWSIFFNAFYFLFVISPMALIVSGFKFKKSCFYVFHFIFLYLFFGAACAINFRFAGESVKFWLLFLHPCFIIIPIILNVFMYISLCKYNKIVQKNEEEKNNENIINTNMTFKQQLL